MSRILVVDDMAEARHLLRTILTHAGHEIIEATNGAEALQIARNGSFDLVVSDGLMPVMDGFRLCIELRRSPETRALPFIIYTASFTASEDAELASTTGADAYLLKPAEPAMILKTVHDVLSRPSAEPRDAVPNEDLIEVFESYSQRIEQKLDEKIAALSSMRALRDSYHALLDNLPVHILTLDLLGRVDFANATTRAFINNNGPTAFLDAVHASDKGAVHAFLESLREDPRSMQMSARVRRRDGAYCVFEITARPYDSPDGERLGFLLVGEDVTRLEQERELLLHAAEYDPLTDLPTRPVFDRRFDEILRNVGKGARCALLFIDSNDLKGINDQYGFDVGDATIANIAHMIVEASRPGDLAARLCATEFVVLAEDLDREDAERLADTIRSTVAEASLVPAAPEMRINVNISISLVPEVQLPAASGNRNERTTAEPSAEHRLIEALRGQPAMLYRPVYSLEDGHLIRCLVRYAYAVNERLISGDELALGAVKHGVARRMGRRIVDLALEQVHLADIPCSVPLSLANLLDPMIFERAELAAESGAVDPSHLLFEVPDCDAGGIRPPASWLAAARRSTIRLVHVCADLATLRADHITLPAGDEISLPATEVLDPSGNIRPSARSVIDDWQALGVTITVTDIKNADVIEQLKALGISQVAGDALSPSAPHIEDIPRTLPER
ncbi:MAG: diguanylate cyclase [Coriobacteriia bacterium]|nr:diguanylate cyclase [Coriobacteriia bacterium]